MSQPQFPTAIHIFKHIFKVPTFICVADVFLLNLVVLTVDTWVILHWMWTLFGPVLRPNTKEI